MRRVRHVLVMVHVGVLVMVHVCANRLRHMRVRACAYLCVCLYTRAGVPQVLDFGGCDDSCFGFADEVQRNV